MLVTPENIGTIAGDVAATCDSLELESVIWQLELVLKFARARSARGLEMAKQFHAATLDRCVQCVGVLDDDGDGTKCHLCCEYVSLEVQKRNDSIERGDYLRDRAKDEKQ